jgi:hypothetical protein
MCIVPPSPRLASAYAVHFGPHGAVSHLARQRGCCRQWLYREAAWVTATLQGSGHHAESQRLRRRLRELEQQVAALQCRLERAVVLDADKQAEFATVGQARGVSLPDLHALLETLRPGQAASVATLGRWTQEAGRKAGALLAVRDPLAQARVRQAVADEIYVPQPVRMVVEPESLCWLSGRRVERLDGAGWADELGRLPHLEQVIRDGGSCLAKGVADLNDARQRQGLPPVADQLDHFHVLREGGRGVGRAERAARQAERALAAAQAEVVKRRRAARRDQPVGGCLSRLRACQRRAKRALEAWVRQDGLWRQVHAAVGVFTPEGELNTRARAEARLAELLPQLPQAPCADAVGLLRRPQALTYLDEIHRKLGALPVPAEVREAAVQQEGLRRQRTLWQDNAPRAAALRGALLLCAVVLAKAGAVGATAVRAVPSILRSSWRASSLVECVNSVVRMQQARHRKVSQGLLDLKRLYWNTHVFRSGRRKGQSPYQRLGVPWPPGVSWWDVLHWTPERLRLELSTAGSDK